MKFAREIHYFPNMSRESADLTFDAAKAQGTAGIMEWMLKAGQSLEGSQVRVDKNLCREFAIVDNPQNLEIGDIPALSRFMEFFFEDESLPTLLVGWLVPGKDISKESMAGLDLERAGIRLDRPILGLGIEYNQPPHSFCAVVADDAVWQTLVRGETPHSLDGSLSLEPDEANTIFHCAQIALKALMYASLPHGKPKEVTRKQMRTGGKPGVRNRPNRKSLRVVSLPAPAKESGFRKGYPHPKNEGNHKIAAHYRRGHFRFFRDARYKKMRGKFAYVAPTYVGSEAEHPGQANRKQYLIR